MLSRHFACAQLQLRFSSPAPVCRRLALRPRDRTSYSLRLGARSRCSTELCWLSASSFCGSSCASSAAEAAVKIIIPTKENAARPPSPPPSRKNMRTSTTALPRLRIPTRCHLCQYLVCSLGIICRSCPPSASQMSRPVAEKNRENRTKPRVQALLGSRLVCGAIPDFSPMILWLTRKKRLRFPSISHRGTTSAILSRLWHILPRKRLPPVPVPDMQSGEYLQKLSTECEPAESPQCGKKPGKQNGSACFVGKQTGGGVWCHSGFFFDDSLVDKEETASISFNKPQEYNIKDIVETSASSSPEEV
ncbi:unnamed protein product [Amoebophrya sp. A25]|nr:unnamed protein product [Amoebophrya sp. A25]|eukprot:GSA25T00026589001.1